MTMQLSDFVSIGLAFFLFHWVVQTPQTISKKARSVDTLARTFFLGLCLMTLALLRSTGPYSMIMSFLWILGVCIVSHVLWKFYFFLVFANNWQLEPELSLEDLDYRHLKNREWVYQIFFGVDVSISFLFLTIIIYKAGGF